MNQATYKKDTALILDSCFTKHRTHAGHPECPERITAIKAGLEASKLAEECLLLPPVSVNESVRKGVKPQRLATPGTRSSRAVANNPTVAPDP